VPTREPRQVLIAGGGVAALETLLALRSLAGDRVEITLLCPSDEFVYRPVTVAEAFGRGEARTYNLSELVTEAGGDRIITDALASVASRKIAVTKSGERIPFDVLVVATGAHPIEPFPGALTFRGRQDVPALRALLDELTRGEARSLAFALPAERMWSLPLYELALLTAAYLRERGAGAELTLVSPEEEPLALFGPKAGQAILSLLHDRAIRTRFSSLPAAVRARALVFAGSGSVFADRVLTLPLLRGVGLRGLPHDRDGFIPVDLYGRVRGMRDVYVAGDASAFPLKQGGLAAQQADAVAEAIAAEVGANVRPKPFSPVLRGLLLTGGAPLYLRSEPHRLERTATVATDAPARKGHSDHALAAGTALWWPPAKIAGRYLSRYLATARPNPLDSRLLSDRDPIPGRPLDEAEFEDAVELSLLLAECDAKWGDYSSALNALASAEALTGALPSFYEERRRQWLAAEHTGTFV